MRARVLNWISTAFLIAGAGLWALAPGALGLAGDAALGAGVASAAALQAWRLLRDWQVKRRNLLTTSTRVYRLGGGFDPFTALGLHDSKLARRSAAAVSGRQDGLPPYVKGAIDDEIDRALEQPFTLIVGSSLSGKSRAAYEVLCRRFPRAEVWVPAGPQGLRDLLSLDPPPALGWRTVVVWLDELDRYFAGDETATEALFARHLSRRSRWRWRAPRIVFLATVSSRNHDRLIDQATMEGDRFGARHGVDVMGLAEKVVAADEAAAGWDMGEARRLYPGVDFDGTPGRTFAEAEKMLAAYRRNSATVGRAVIRAAIDWQRVAGEWPTKERIRDLLPVELPGEIVSEDDLEHGLRWANGEIAGDQRLLRELRDGGAPRYEAHAYLLDADDGYDEHVDPRPVPDAAWDAAVASLDAAALLVVAERAWSYDQRVTERILVGLAETDAALGSSAWSRAKASFELGAIYHIIPGYEREAETRLEQAAEGPDTEIQVRALIVIGQMLRGQHEREEEAEARLAAAIRAAGPDAGLRAVAQYERGQTRMSFDRMDAAAADFSAAISNAVRDSETLAWSHLHLATIYEEQDRPPDEVLAELTAAIELGVGGDADACAYARRGALRTDLDGKLDDFARALAVDEDPRWHALALTGRGDALAEAGEYEPAEAAYEEAIELDGLEPDDWATHLLDRAATFEGRDPERDEADCEAVLQSAEVSSTLHARAHLRRAKQDSEQLRRRHGTRHLVERVAADVPRVIELDDGEYRAEAHYLRGCLLEHGHGDVDSALADYGAAIATDGASPHTRGSSHIHRGLLFQSEKRCEEAERELTRGIETPDLTPRSLAVGFVDRGLLREDQGRNAEAEADYRAAIAVREGGEPSAGALGYLCDLLRREGRFRDERRLCREAARSGSPDLVGVALPTLEAQGRWAKRVARSYRWLLRLRGAQP